MATVTANKMKSVICKGKLPAIEVARLIHQHHVQGLRGIEPTGITETELKKLASNLNRSEWVGYSHWVDEGIDLLYAFAMKIKSDAALVAAELNMINIFFVKMINVDPMGELLFDRDKWDDIYFSIEANIHSLIWHYEALQVVSKYLKTDWTLIVSAGMQSMETAIGLINQTLQDTGFKSIDVESLKPDASIVKEWGLKAEEVEVRDFLLGVVEVEDKVEISIRYEVNT